MTQKRDEKVRFSFQEKEKMNENQLIFNHNLALITTIIYLSNMVFKGLYFSISYLSTINRDTMI